MTELNGYVSVRELLNAFLDIDPDKLLSIKCSFSRITLSGTSSRIMDYVLCSGSMVGNQFLVDEPIWYFATNSELPTQEDFSEPKVETVLGYITMRELFNSLIELDPKTLLAIDGNPDNLWGLALSYGRFSEFGARSFNRNLQPLWRI